VYRYIFGPLINFPPCWRKFKDLLIDWLVFNANFSNISPISWHQIEKCPKIVITHNASEPLGCLKSEYSVTGHFLYTGKGIYRCATGMSRLFQLLNIWLGWWVITILRHFSIWCHDIGEILLKLALNTNQSINKSLNLPQQGGKLIRGPKIYRYTSSCFR
jgi:hypothetical protein